MVITQDTTTLSLVYTRGVSLNSVLGSPEFQDSVKIHAPNMEPRGKDHCNSKKLVSPGLK